MDEKWFLALDGDDIGRHLELCMLTEDLVELKRFSEAFDGVKDKLVEKVLSFPGSEVVMNGGDSLLFLVDPEQIDSIADAFLTSCNSHGFTYSGGYGNSMRDAYLALKLAKSRGKNRIEVAGGVA